MKLIHQTFLSLIVGLLVSSGNPVLADHPGDIFARCSMRLRQLVGDCLESNRQSLRECVPVIRVLLRQNKYHEARIVAERCIQRIDRISQRYASSVQQMCRECIRRLLELNAPELAARLGERCENALQTIDPATTERLLNLFKPPAPSPPVAANVASSPAAE